MISILIAEDQSMVLGALAALLALEPDFDIVGTVENGNAALEHLRRAPPAILLTDIEMPELGGLELAQQVQTLGAPTRVIILTTFARSGYLRRALDAGVSGYLLKAAPSRSLAEAIRKVHGGGKVIAPELALDAWGERDPLSDRERQVLRLAVEGKSSAEIAVKVCLSEGTVRNYLSEAISKLGAQNRIDAGRIARDRGWL
ncbi:MAG: response regulator transcription factor [Pseudomonadota bacterium]|nr:response regulator transcription factor [Pseudomonadota bacterium]